MGNYLVGIDGGNTSCKVVIFDETGNIVSASATPSIRIRKRGEGFEEIELDEMWFLIANCISLSISKAGIDPKEIRGIGSTSYGNGLVFVGKNGETIGPACLSQDYRANGIISMFQKDGTFEKIQEIVKGLPFAGEPGPILRWYKDNEREVYDQIGGVMTFKDYISMKLTGVVATDLNCWGGSFMLDMETFEHSEELMKLYGIEEMWPALPKLAESPTEIIGTVTSKAADETGLEAGTPVVAGMMDILASLVGAGGTGDDIYTAIVGSWSINETHSDRIIPGISFNMPYLFRGQYLNCSCTGASGSNYEWFIRELGHQARSDGTARGISLYTVLDELIESVPIDEAKVLFSPFVAQPSIHQNAKANFFNIDLDTTYPELVYAVAEGVAYIHRYHVDILKEAGLPLKEVRLTGGTARSTVWNRIFSNVLQTPIVGVDCAEAGALGSAIAAGIGAGIYKDYDDAFSRAVKLKDPVLPDPDTRAVYDRRYEEWTQLNKVMKEYWDWKN